MKTRLKKGDEVCYVTPAGVVYPFDRGVVVSNPNSRMLSVIWDADGERTDLHGFSIPPLGSVTLYCDEKPNRIST